MAAYRSPIPPAASPPALAICPRTMNLLPEFGRMRDIGVDILRISPQANHTDKVIDLFHRALTGELDPMEASTSLERLMPTGPCDGYWHGGAGMDVQDRAGQAA